MKGFGPIRIIIALAAIAILAGGGLYYWGAYRQNLDITRGNGIIKFLGFSPSNELSPEERKLFEDRGIGIYSDSIDASTWKIYRNEKYGFEVRYPEKGLVKETDLVYDAPFMKLIVSFYENELKEESYKPIVEIFVRDDNFDINTLPDLQPYKLGGMDARIWINNKSEKLSTPLGGADILTYKNKSDYWYLIRTTENPLLENKISTSILSTFKFI